MIGIRFVGVEVPPGALAAFRVYANDHDIGEVRQTEHGLWPGSWLALPPNGGPPMGGYRKRGDAADALLERTGVLE